MRKKFKKLISTMAVFSISHVAFADTKPNNTIDNTSNDQNSYIFKLMPYKENYLLLFNYSDRTYDSFYNINQIAPNDETVKKSEVEFQFSIPWNVENIADMTMNYF